MMTDAERRVKVMDGLELCLEGLCDLCPYKDSDAPGGCRDELMYDALALLKAQEPRVILFDEIDDYDVLWLEVRDVETEDGLAPWVKTKSGRLLGRRRILRRCAGRTGARFRRWRKSRGGRSGRRTRFVSR